LLQLAGKTLAVVMIATGALLPQKSEANQDISIASTAGAFYTLYAISV
jgi:hypothetical protein